MLLSNIIPGFSLAEAKDSITEYGQFKTAMEVCTMHGRFLFYLVWYSMLRMVWCVLSLRKRIVSFSPFGTAWCFKLGYNVVLCELLILLLELYDVLLYR